MPPSTTFRAIVRSFCVSLGFAAVLLWSGADQPFAAQAARRPASRGARDPVLIWNDIALRAVADDHSGTYGVPDQPGPTRTSRALAIVHIAIFDAANALLGGFEPYIPVTGLPHEVFAKGSVDAAVAQAAHDTLVALYPSHAQVFARELEKALRSVPVRKGRAEGVQVGALAAANTLAARVNDGGDAPDEPSSFSPVKEIGEHQPDPINPDQGFLTPLWGLVTPFAMDNVANFQAPPPPQPDAASLLERIEYAYYYEEVKRLGGDGINTPTQRTAEQTEIGIFWGYDGSIKLGVPPRLYNQITRVIALQKKNITIENARLFALVNIAMADAGIAAWYSKYDYNFWRPIIGIRCGADDGNELTIGDETWTPLGAQATNRSNGGRNFSPPFPAYASGHATFGAAMFRTLANVYGNNTPFEFMSDEFNGKNTDPNGVRRKRRTRKFNTFSQAAVENADSRIYLGIHWGFDAEEGVTVGNNIADYVHNHYLNPLQGSF